MKKTLVLFADTASHLDMYDDYFEIRKVSKVSFREILFSKNTAYFFDKTSKKKYRYQYTLAKITGKKLKNKDFFTLFFKVTTSKSNIFISNDFSLAYWFYNYFTADLKKNFSFTTFPHSKFNHDRKAIIKLIANIFTHEKRIVNPAFHGKIIVLNYQDTGLLDLIKRKYPNATIIIKYVDLITPKIEKYHSLQHIMGSTPLPEEVTAAKNSINELKTRDISLCSYSAVEAEFYGIDYEPNAISLASPVIKDPSPLKNGSWVLAFAISEPRFGPLVNLMKTLELAGFATFISVPEGTEEQYDVIKKISHNYKHVTISSVHIDHQRYLELQKASPVLFDLYRIYPDEGYSFRISEALAWNKKIITNRSLIKKEKFYNPEMILVSETMDFKPEELIKFASTNPVGYSGVENFGIENSIFM